MASKQNQEGYLLIDNRFGPGVTAEFIRSTGKWAPVVGEGATYESATVTCTHCGTIVVLNPDRTRPRSYCRRCDAYICDGCAALGECVPFEKILLDLQDAAYHKHE